MRRFAAVLILALIFCGSAGAATRAEWRLFHRINHARVNHGVRPLVLGRYLTQRSHDRAVYLRKHNLFRHPRNLPIGTGENIGWLTCRPHWPRVLVRWWLESPTHREHLLDPGFRRIGVGVSRGPYLGYPCALVAVTRFR